MNVFFVYLNWELWGNSIGRLFLMITRKNVDNIKGTMWIQMKFLYLRGSAGMSTRCMKK